MDGCLQSQFEQSEVLILVPQRLLQLRESIPRNSRLQKLVA